MPPADLVRFSLASNGVNDPQRFTLTASRNVDGILALLPGPLNAGNMAM
jgi:hypothetical protein